jgi:2,4-dienoyl-CoA reductase-like NADH-dependent reductase (Old Yellow Enzyme family)
MTQATQDLLGMPYKLNNGSELKNRLVKAAMSEQLSDRNHNPTPELCRLYRTWASADIGLLITGNVMIDRSALGAPKNIVLDAESNLELFIEWAKAGKINQTKIWMQLNHPGKQAPNYLTSQPVAPSAIPFEGTLAHVFNCPRALSSTEITAIIKKFSESALLAKKAGFDGVEIHGAHGYLISQFLSKRHNQRTDEWGGSLENRSRFLLAVYQEIRKAVGNDFGVGVKINSADFSKEGFSQEESRELLKMLDSTGVDFIEISGGTYENPVVLDGKKTLEKECSTSHREAYFLEYAKNAKKSVKTTIMVTGGFRSAAYMNNALQAAELDLVGVARPFAIHPEWSTKLVLEPDFIMDLQKPSIGSKRLNRLLAIDLIWYEYQMQRIAKGKKPEKNIMIWKGVLSTLFSVGVSAFKTQRA